jgi:hypothetical protein
MPAIAEMIAGMIMVLFYWHGAVFMECGGLLPRNRENKFSHSIKILPK